MRHSVMHRYCWLGFRHHIDDPISRAWVRASSYTDYDAISNAITGWSITKWWCTGSGLVRINETGGDGWVRDVHDYLIYRASNA